MLIGSLFILLTLGLVLAIIGIDARSRNAVHVGEVEDKSVSELAPAVKAPEMLTFQAKKHLKDLDYEVCIGSKDRDLYKLDPFTELDGKEMTPEKLLEVRMQWVSECHRVQGIVEQRQVEEKDPNHQQLSWLEGKLKDHPFFKRVSYEKVASQQFVFFIEQPRKQDPAYYDTLVRKHTPWLHELEELFVQDYAVPLKLTRKTPYGSHALSVLSSATHYHTEYAQLVGDPSLAHTAAHYLPALRMITTFEDSVLPVEAAHRRTAILHELVHSLQHQFYSEGEDMPKPMWFIEGLAEYLSAGKLDRVSDLRGPRLDKEYLRQYLRLMEFDKEGTYSNSLSDLISIEGPGYASLINLAARRARASGTKSSSGFLGINPDWAKAAFYRQSYLLMHYLHQGAEGRHRQGFQRYFEAVMKGGHGLGAFREAFDGMDPAAMEKDFSAHLKKLARKHFPGGVLDAGENFAQFIAKLVAAKPPSKPAPRPSFDPRTLDLAADEWQARLALALRRASQGRVDEALKSLEGAIGKAANTGIKTRLGREINRLKEIRELRRELLEEAARKHETLLLGSERGEVMAVDLATGRVSLKSGKTTREAPVESLATKDLLQKAKDRLTGSKYWMAPYLRFLCGGSPADILKDSILNSRHTALARELREDLAGDLEQVRGLSDAAEAVAGLAAWDPASPGDRAAAALKDLQALLAKHDRSELVLRRRNDLKSLAASLVEPQFDPTQSSCLGIRTLERLTDGRVKVAYGLKSPWVMEDFIAENGYLDGMRRLNIQSGNLDEIGPSDSSGFHVQRGELVGKGSACIRLALPLVAPLETRLRFRFTPEMDGQRAYFLLGVCGDDQEHFLGIDWFGGLLATDDLRNRYVEGSNLKWDPSSIYELDVRHSGTELVARVLKHKTRVSESKLEGQLSRQGGFIFLWVHSRAPFVLLSLEVTGKLDDSSLPELKARWVESEVKKYFPQ